MEQLAPKSRNIYIYKKSQQYSRKYGLLLKCWKQQSQLFYSIFAMKYQRNHVKLICHLCHWTSAQEENFLISHFPKDSAWRSSVSMPSLNPSWWRREYFGGQTLGNVWLLSVTVASAIFAFNGLPTNHFVSKHPLVPVTYPQFHQAPR